MSKNKRSILFWLYYVFAIAVVIAVLARFGFDHPLGVGVWVLVVYPQSYFMCKHLHIAKGKQFDSTAKIKLVINLVIGFALGYVVFLLLIKFF